MNRTADTALEKAFEAALAGRPVPPGAGGLAAFTGAVRATATQPGRPNPALAELLATGLTVDRPDSSPQAAGRRRRVMRFTQIASAGAVARAAAAGIVVAGVTGAGAAGILTAAAPHAVPPVVESGTSVPSPEQRSETVTTTSAAPTTRSPGSPTGEGGDRTTPTPADSMPAGYDCDPSKPFRVCVNEHRHAQDSPLTPAQVDEWARYHEAHSSAPQESNQGRTQNADTGRPATPSVDSADQQGGRGQSDASRGTPHGQGRP
jgi:hypothetical protein